MAVMPQGVEHKPSHKLMWRGTNVAMAVMPQGVEHGERIDGRGTLRRVAMAVMPQGVEHVASHVGGPSSRGCSDGRDAARR